MTILSGKIPTVFTNFVLFLSYESPSFSSLNINVRLGKNDVQRDLEAFAALGNGHIELALDVLIIDGE